MRKIYIAGQINTDAYLEFSKEVDRLAAESTKPIHVELVSEGGHAYDAMAFYGKIISCKCNIIITAHGYVHSAGTLILAAGDLRYCTPEISIMVHESSNKFKGNTSTLKELVRHEEEEELAWSTLMAKHTKASVEAWLQMNKKTTYLNADQAKFYGLVDKIIGEK